MEKLENNWNPSTFQRYVWVTCFRSHRLSELELELEIELTCPQKRLKGSDTKNHLPVTTTSTSTAQEADIINQILLGGITSGQEGRKEETYIECISMVAMTNKMWRGKPGSERTYNVPVSTQLVSGEAGILIHGQCVSRVLSTRIWLNENYLFYYPTCMGIMLGHDSEQHRCSLCIHEA